MNGTAPASRSASIYPGSIHRLSRSSSTSGITAITGFIHILLMLELSQPRPNLSGFGILPVTSRLQPCFG